MIGAISIVALFYAPIGFAAKDGINSATVSYTKTAGGLLT